MKRISLILLVALSLLAGLVIGAVPAHASAGGNHTYGPVPWPEPYFIGNHPIRWQPGTLDDGGAGLYVDGAYPISVVDNGSSWSVTFGTTGGTWVPISDCSPTYNSLGQIVFNQHCVQFVTGYQAVGYNVAAAKPVVITFPDGSSGSYASFRASYYAVNGGWPVDSNYCVGCSTSGPLATANENLSNIHMSYSWATDSWDSWAGCFAAKQGCPNPKPLE